MRSAGQRPVNQHERKIVPCSGVPGNLPAQHNIRGCAAQRLRHKRRRGFEHHCAPRGITQMSTTSTVTFEVSGLMLNRIAAAPGRMEIGALVAEANVSAR